MKQTLQPKSVGFIGLGIMGRPMAENLAKHYRVLGFDTQQERFEGILGVQRAASASELARNCDVLVLSLPSATIVESVLLGDWNLLESLSPGTLVLDLSTGEPATSKRIAAALRTRGVDYADAPVSGGEAGAKAGSLAIMVGAEPDAFVRCLPYLKILGKSVVRAGDIGAGNVAKLVNNMIVGVTFSVIAEGFALAVSHGIDPSLLHLAIKDGWAGSPVLEASAPAIVARDYRPGGTINMIQKDLTSAASLAAEHRISLPLTEAASELYRLAQAAGFGSQSQPAIFELWNLEGALR